MAVEVAVGHVAVDLSVGYMSVGWACGRAHGRGALGERPNGEGVEWEERGVGWEDVGIGEGVGWESLYILLLDCHGDATGVLLGCYWSATGMLLGCYWSTRRSMSKNNKEEHAVVDTPGMQIVTAMWYSCNKNEHVLGDTPGIQVAATLRSSCSAKKKKKKGRAEAETDHTKVDQVREGAHMDPSSSTAPGLSKQEEREAYAYSSQGEDSEVG
jgi:hypothetical protein